MAIALSYWQATYFLLEPESSRVSTGRSGGSYGRRKKIKTSAGEKEEFQAVNRLTPKG
jgi:hypothetical protein